MLRIHYTNRLIIRRINGHKAIPSNPKYQQQLKKKKKKGPKSKIIIQKLVQILKHKIPFLIHAIQDQILLNLQNTPRQQL